MVILPLTLIHQNYYFSHQGYVEVVHKGLSFFFFISFSDGISLMISIIINYFKSPQARKKVDISTTL